MAFGGRSSDLATAVVVVFLSLASVGWIHAQNAGGGGTGDAVCNPSVPDFTNACMGCICTASSKCNQTIGCVGGGDLCGPFLLSRAFWLDAGGCTLPGRRQTDPDAFVECANDLGCASDTIRSYVNRFLKDCNGDQLVTCDDFMMLHKNGGWNCGRNLQGTPYAGIFQDCKQEVIREGYTI